MMIGLEAGLGCGGRCRASLYRCFWLELWLRLRLRLRLMLRLRLRLRVRVAPGSGKALQSPGNKRKAT